MWGLNQLRHVSRSELLGWGLGPCFVVHRLQRLRIIALFILQPQFQRFHSTVKSCILGGSVGSPSYSIHRASGAGGAPYVQYYTTQWVVVFIDGSLGHIM